MTHHFSPNKAKGGGDKEKNHLKSIIDGLFLQGIIFKQ